MLLIKKILLFISAYIPLYILLLIKIGLQLANSNLHFNILNSIMLGLLFTMTILGAIGIFFGLNAKNYVQIYIKSAKNITEKHFLGYLSLFVLFALNFQIEYYAMAATFAVVLIFIGIVYIKNDLFYINPTLNILGYSFYEITYISTNSNEQQASYLLYKGKLEYAKTYDVNFSSYNLNITKS